MVAIRSLPHSNADCERAFSVIQKVHTECRQSLNGDTLTALLQCMLKYDVTGYEFNAAEERVALVKRINHEYNMQHQ